MLASVTGALTVEFRQTQALTRSRAQIHSAGVIAGGVLGTLAFFGAFAVWLVPREQELRFGVTSVNIDGTAIPLDQILDIRLSGRHLVVTTSDGERRSPSLLSPDALTDALAALARIERDPTATSTVPRALQRLLTATSSAPSSALRPSAP